MENQPIDSLRIVSGIPERREGAVGEQITLNWIGQELTRLNLNPERQRIESEAGHSFSESIICRIDGQSEGVFILLTPIDNGAAGIAIMLELAKIYSNQPPNHSVLLAFLGGERGETPYHPYGSHQLLSSLPKNTSSFALYLNMESSPSRTRIITGGDGKIAPSWFIKSLSDALSLEGMPFNLRTTDLHAARLGLQGSTGPFSAWIQSEIPSLELGVETTSPPAGRPRDLKRIVDALLRVEQTAGSQEGSPTGGFVLLRPFPNQAPLYIPELIYITAFIVIMGIMMSLILLQSRDIQLNLRRLTSYWWTWPLLYFIVFLFLFISTLLIEETLLWTQFPTLWTHAPGVFIFFKLTVAAALTLNFILVTQGLPLPRSPHFYSYTAVFTAFVALLIFLALDVSLALYALGALIMQVLVIATRKERLKVALMILAVAPYGVALWIIVTEPYPEILQFLLLERIPGNLLLALLLSPTILTATSLNYWRIHYHRARRSVFTPAATLALSLASLITIPWILNLSPFSDQNPQSVEIADQIDQNQETRRLVLSSSAPIGEAKLLIDSVAIPLSNLGREAEVQAPLSIRPIDLSQQSNAFLGRRTIEVSIDGDAPPHTIELRLQSLDSFTMHQCSQPYIMNSAGNEAKLLVGANPPFPFTITLTVNTEAKLNLDVEAHYDEPEASPHILGTHLSGNSSRIVSAQIEL